MPFENTSRSPRLRNCEGMNPSRARIEASRGKSWYAVFAARMRIRAVNVCSTTNMTPSPNTVSPICASTDVDAAMCSSVRTFSSAAKPEIPRNIGMLMAPISSSVVAAFFDCGRRNAGTPSAIASTPVRAVAPDENALRTSSALIPEKASSSRPAVAAVGHPSVAQSQIPRRSVMPTTTTKPYVGIANSRPASFAPRRFASVTNTMNATAMGVLKGASAGTADVTAIEPAVTLTATVST